MPRLAALLLLVAVPEASAQLPRRAPEDTAVVSRRAVTVSFALDGAVAAAGAERAASRVDLRTPGARRFIAHFRNFADTLDVRVVPRDTTRSNPR